MEERRRDFVKQAAEGKKSKSALCREFGISRPTGDKWISRDANGEPLSDRSRRPLRTPRKTAPKTETAVLELRDRHPALGAAKLKRMLENDGQPAPARSTINSILKRNGRISEAASHAATPYRRFERAEPNELWQADFKGDFALQDKRRCHPLTILDDHSRFCLCLEAKENQRREGVCASLQRLFEEYGLPDCILCDNGNPWGTSQSVGYTRLEVWLMDHGVLTIHGRPLHPQTQGKEERFNGTLKRELLQHRQLADMLAAQAEFDEYRRFYNEKRPHHALGLEVPSSRYQASRRRYESRISEWQYPPGYEVRKAKSSGYMTFRGQGYFISEALGERVLGLREAAEAGGLIDVFYRQFRVARIDLDERAVVSRRAFLHD